MIAKKRERLLSLCLEEGKSALTLRKLDGRADQERQDIVRSPIHRSTIREQTFRNRELLFLRLGSKQRLDGANQTCDRKL